MLKAALLSTLANLIIVHPWQEVKGDILPMIHFLCFQVCCQNNSLLLKDGDTDELYAGYFWVWLAILKYFLSGLPRVP